MLGAAAALALLAGCAPDTTEQRLEEERVLLESLPGDARSRFLYEVNEPGAGQVAVARYFETDRRPDDVARDVADRLGGFGCGATGSPDVRYRCGEYECYLTLLPASESASTTVYAITATWRANGGEARTT